MHEALSHAEPAPAPADTPHVDVLIVGAGISGVCAAYYLQSRCPGKSYAILEARDAIGGTWDLFRYPGIRSDSDLYTFGFSFHPWMEDKSIADGASILRYLQETVSAYGIDRHIRFGQRVVAADWSTSDARWTVEIEGAPNVAARTTCNFLCACAGYYDYAEGYLPTWPGTERFRGRCIHPQAWPDDFDYSGKRIVVIGSGATAVTLVPELAKNAAHVTMLQRSPSYIVSLPAKDRIANWLRDRLPARLAHGIARWKNILISIVFYQYARRKPEAMAKRVLDRVRRQIGPAHDVERHFKPRYKPWDQRVCLVPNGDLFRAIREGRASIETDTIETFTEAGLQLASGKHLDADIVVTATGLKLKMLGGMRLSVDDREVEPANTYLYKGMMLNDVPNFAVAIGYTNASWTLKCELTARYVCRLLNRMDSHGDAWCVPRRRGIEGAAPAIDFTSGYIQRSLHLLPKQGERKPWRLHQNYVLDLAAMSFAPIDDGTMEFGRPVPRQQAA